MANKKYLDEVGLAYVIGLLEDYPDNEILAALIDAIQDGLDEKASTALATTSTPGLMSADDKLVLDHMNPNVTTTISDGLVESIHIVNAKRENLLDWECSIEPVISQQIRTSNLLDVSNILQNAYINSSGGIATSTNDYLGDFMPVSPGDDIYYTGTVGETTTSSINRRLHVYDANQRWIKQMSYQGGLRVGSHWSTHGVVPSNGAYVRVSWGITDYNVMVSVGAPSSYEPYYITPFSAITSTTFYVSPDGTTSNANTYTANVPAATGNLYSFKINPVKGKITTVSGHIASYNGETLPGEWISDRDIYSEGSTPSTGAEVIYTLDPEDVQEYDITPIEIQTFYRHNYFWVDGGKISLLSYLAETFAANHFTVYDAVTFGNTYVQESDIINWNNTITALDTKADLDSPTFTGTVRSPNPGSSSNDTTIATTHFVTDKLNDTIATVEGNKASKNYSVGEYLIKAGQLYKVIATIASGVTLTEGTNIEATDVATELNLLFSQLS